ncbi:MAG TPA: pyridoxamine 5'-phosphate oxidase family protein, partial [Spirochaetia bacterium]|nr:pyridoxamine 5'-phosphate oxidase family protein [Spirochaetia bacterium]
PTLDEIVSIRGAINLVENPSLRAEVLEMLGPRLRTFWKLAHDPRDLVVLETVVEEATHFLPMEGRKEVVRF